MSGSKFFAMFGKNRCQAIYTPNSLCRIGYTGQLDHYGYLSRGPLAEPIALVAQVHERRMQQVIQEIGLSMDFPEKESTKFKRIDKHFKNPIDIRT